MKKLTCLSLMVLIFLGVNVRAAGTYSGGDGSEANPYKISTPADMQEIGTNPDDFDKYFLLTNDIDLGQFKGDEFNLIGSYDEYDNLIPFMGIFDGNGHSISNFNYYKNNDDPFKSIGLFISIYGGTVENLTLIDPNVIAPLSGGVGSLAGGLFEGYIWNCTAKGGRICGRYAVGGLAGWVESQATVNNCKINGSIVSGNDYVGGIFGYCESSTTTINNCSAVCNVTGNMWIGGFAGVSSCLISNSFVGGQVWGKERVGGLVGQNDGQIRNCYSTANVTGDTAVGGLIAWENYGDVVDCYAAGIVDGNDGVGGFAGIDEEAYEEPFYTRCFWDNSMNPSLDGIGNISDPNVQGRSKDQMMEQGTFAGWDFANTWGIAEDQTYPYLRPSIASDLNDDQVVNLLDLAELANNWLYSSPWVQPGYQTVVESIEMLELNIKALDQIKLKVTQMRELASQSATGAYSAEQREEMNGEFNQLRIDINNIADCTMYRGIKMLNHGSGTLYINTGKGYLEIDKVNVTSLGLGITWEVDISTVEGAQSATEVLNTDMDELTLAANDYKSKQDLLRGILESF